MTAITFENVSFEYKHGSGTIIKNINLTIDEPGLYCIIGPNGVGKSTLVKCICKINKPTSGRITIDGKDLSEIRQKDVAKEIGYVPAGARDEFSMTVINTIMVGRYNKHKWGSGAEDLEATYKVMKLMHIEELGMKRFNDLSAGQHQKVAIARGLIQEPRVLILDEPTANLDVKYQVYVTQLLRALSESEKMTILMISHDLNTSAKYAHKIIMMAKPGILFAVGTPEDVLTEQNIEEVYGVKCKVRKDDGEIGEPYIVLKDPIMTNED